MVAEDLLALPSSTNMTQQNSLGLDDSSLHWQPQSLYKNRSESSSMFKNENDVTYITEAGEYRMVGYPSGYSTTEVYLISIFTVLIMASIIVGNLLVIIAIFFEYSLQCVQNWFVASLALADLAIGVLIMPFSLSQEVVGYWLFGEAWCQIYSALDVLLCTASILNITLISLDRYWSITCAVKVKRMTLSGIIMYPQLLQFMPVFLHYVSPHFLFLRFKWQHIIRS